MPSSLLAQIRSAYPDPQSLPYYERLFSSGWDFDATVRAHLQDLARAIGCRGLREIQLARLDEFARGGKADLADIEGLREAILDELDAPGKKSHYEIRLMLFDGMGLLQEELECVEPTEESRKGTFMFREIFERGSLVEITAAVGAIEEWYVPLAARLEAAYLGLGYSKRQVSTYTLHKVADIRHSNAALGFVCKYAEVSEAPNVLEAVRKAFDSVIYYDRARFVAAQSAGRSIGNTLRNV